MIDWMQEHWQLAVWALAAVVVAPTVIRLTVGAMGEVWSVFAAIFDRTPAPARTDDRHLDDL